MPQAPTAGHDGHDEHDEHDAFLTERSEGARDDQNAWLALNVPALRDRGAEGTRRQTEGNILAIIQTL